MCVFTCVCACVCACGVRAPAHACVRAYVHASVCVCVCKFACMCLHVCACIEKESVVSVGPQCCHNSTILVTSCGVGGSSNRYQMNFRGCGNNSLRN